MGAAGFEPATSRVLSLPGLWPFVVAFEFPEDVTVSLEAAVTRYVVYESGLQCGAGDVTFCGAWTRGRS